MGVPIRFRNYCCLAFALLWVVSANAAVTLPNVFSDHMVLQRDKEIPVWGWAEPGEAVTVQTVNQKMETVTDAEGRWSVLLEPMEAGGPHMLYARTENDVAIINDILVGEVWICSGQSNMQWTVANSADADSETRGANYPKIRMFSVERLNAETPQSNCNGEWEITSPETVSDFSAVGYFFARKLHQELKVPVGMIHTSWGGTPAESWTTQQSLEANPLYEDILSRWDARMADLPEAKKRYEEALKNWETEQAAATAANQKFTKRRPHPPWGPDHPWRPAGLYNAMIAPLVPYAMQGAIWYQGESNAGRAYQYRELFPRMIQDWRDAWGGEDFPFYFVQLANFMERKEEPADSAWAELREAQSMTLDKLKNTGMAVTIDIGEAADIHPKNKQEVGRRLALIALNHDYDGAYPYTGPVFQRVKTRRDKIVVVFKDEKGGLKTTGKNKPTGWQITGADGEWRWADAKIKHSKVELSSKYIEKPVAVRYGWADNPACNLRNDAGLPASPFRTDDWPGITVDAK
jgi:sialate O-acetylesterase